MEAKAKAQSVIQRAEVQATINIETVIAAKSFHAFVFLSISMPVTGPAETEIAALTSSCSQSRSRSRSQSQSQQTVFDCLTSGLDCCISFSVTICFVPFHLVFYLFLDFCGIANYFRQVIAREAPRHL